MCLQQRTICGECGKDTDGLMTCTLKCGEQIQLCPDCLKHDGRFCFGCGYICSAQYCDGCLDEFDEEDQDYDDMEYDQDWPDEDEFDEDDEL